MSRHEPVGDPLRDSSQVENSEKYEHQAHGQFHGEANAGRDHQVEENDRRADEQNGDRVAKAPEYSNQARMPDTSLPAYYRSHGNDVVRIRRVANSQQKTHANYCQQVDHRIYLELPSLKSTLAS